MDQIGQIAGLTEQKVPRKNVDIFNSLYKTQHEPTDSWSTYLDTALENKVSDKKINDVIRSKSSSLEKTCQVIEILCEAKRAQLETFALPPSEVSATSAIDAPIGDSYVGLKDFWSMSKEEQGYYLLELDERIVRYRDLAQSLAKEITQREDISRVGGIIQAAFSNSPELQSKLEEYKKTFPDSDITNATFLIVDYDRLQDKVKELTETREAMNGARIADEAKGERDLHKQRANELERIADELRQQVDEITQERDMYKQKNTSLTSENKELSEGVEKLYLFLPQ